MWKSGLVYCVILWLPHFWHRDSPALSTCTESETPDGMLSVINESKIYTNGRNIYSESISLISISLFEVTKMLWDLLPQPNTTIPFPRPSLTTTKLVMFVPPDSFMSVTCAEYRPEYPQKHASVASVGGGHFVGLWQRSSSSSLQKTCGAWICCRYCLMPSAEKRTITKSKPEKSQEEG